MPDRTLPISAAVLAVVVLVALALDDLTGSDTSSGAVAGAFMAGLALDGDPRPRNLDPYRGHGTWVDAFDFDPAYQAEGGEPALAPASVDEMADAGVRTIYLQAARIDERSPAMLTDRSLLAQFLIRAHRRDLAVVGWYLPKFADIDADLAHLEAMADFEVAGHRLDGVAVDIEFTDDVPDHGARSARLVELSQRLRASRDGEALGAIVLPPVQIEVVNPAFWPGFPWRDLASLYDVWLPMSYWTFRTEDSGYQDGFSYNAESTERLRANLGDGDAVVHGIGGIGDEATAEDLGGFVRSLVETGSVGGSIYDWDTLAPESRRAMTELFVEADGSLPSPGDRPAG
ncbi:hypothetical protein BH20ACT2_BH20ACT2_23470 [soil metagenome]